jgi:DNA-3-methyladenine glycosylase I
MRASDPPRCAWVAGARATDVRYHDEEWGVPLHDDRALFELLVLEGAQAGLSWSTILARREGYRAVFEGFDPARLARWRAADCRRALADARIVRHPGKVASVVTNARALLAVRAAHGTFDAWLWAQVPGAPVQPARRPGRRLPAETPASRALSAALRARGFIFVGPTICYAYMQAAGLVNDHTVDCFRWRAVAGRARGRRR